MGGIGHLLFVTTLSLFVRQAGAVGASPSIQSNASETVVETLQQERWRRHLRVPALGSRNFQEAELAYKEIYNGPWPEEVDAGKETESITKDTSRGLLFTNTEPTGDWSVTTNGPVTRILLAHSKKHPKHTYTQGMNQVASLLFKVLNNETQAFCAFVELLETRGLYKEIWSRESMTLAKAEKVFGRFLQTAAESTGIEMYKLQQLAGLPGLGYLQCTFMAYNPPNSTFPKWITYKVWDMLITKPDGYGFMVKFSTALLSTAITKQHEGRDRFDRILAYACNMSYTKQDCLIAFQSCLPPKRKNDAPTCQIPGCSKRFVHAFVVTRRHHCRPCGMSICADHSRFPVGPAKENRFCPQCAVLPPIHELSQRCSERAATNQ